MDDKWILDEAGVPTPEPNLMKWAKWFEQSAAQRRVELTQITDQIKVSTVFLGLDYGWGEGPPILYETMIFGGKLKDSMWRYATREQAEAGHAAAVRAARAELQ